MNPNNYTVAEFKNKIEKGPVLGPFCKTLDPSFVEVLGYSGFDFCILDMEHGPATASNLTDLIRACDASGIMPVVRVAEISESAIGKALDLGAGAVQIPQVSTPAQAKKAVELAKFYPMGERGVCRFVRAAGFSSIAKEDYFVEANNTMVIIQLEGIEAIQNLDAILQVEGIDIIFIGPYDLSQSLGIPGQVTHPKVIESMKMIVAAAAKKKIKVGTFTDTSESMHQWMDYGVQYISYSVDIGIFVDACRTLVDDFKVHFS